MVYALFGTCAALACFLIDQISLRRIPYLKQIIEVVSSLVMIYSLIMLSLEPAKIRLAPWLSYGGWIMLIISLFLLCFSLFWEIPFRETYMSTHSHGRLVDTGTFALTRHPEVLWTALLFSSLFLITGGQMLLIACLLWIALLALRVYVMEKVYLERVFGEEYRQYQKGTPMMIPTRKSLQRCICTLRVYRSAQ
jgi:protein-S-isoprenylcysteine O-methyltransferase Ste14